MYLSGYDWGPHGVDLATRKSKQVERCCDRTGPLRLAIRRLARRRMSLDGQEVPDHAGARPARAGGAQRLQGVARTGGGWRSQSRSPGRSSSKRHETNSSRDRTADAACLSHLLPRDHRAGRICWSELRDGEFSGYGESCRCRTTALRWKASVTAWKPQQAGIEAQTVNDVPRHCGSGWGTCWAMITSSLVRRGRRRHHNLWGKKLGQPVHKLWGLDLSRTGRRRYTIGIDSVPHAGRERLPGISWLAVSRSSSARRRSGDCRGLRRQTAAMFRVDANAPGLPRRLSPMSRELGPWASSSSSSPCRPATGTECGGCLPDRPCR